MNKSTVTGNSSKWMPYLREFEDRISQRNSERRLCLGKAMAWYPGTGHITTPRHEGVREGKPFSEFRDSV